MYDSSAGEHVGAAMINVARTQVRGLGNALPARLVPIGCPNSTGKGEGQGCGNDERLPPAGWTDAPSWSDSAPRRGFVLS